MKQMQIDFEKTLRNQQLFDSKHHVLLAVSGGVDSIVLFHLMQKVAQTNQITLSVAHVNHQLRPEANAEEAFVRKLGEAYNIPVYVYTWDTKEQPKSGTEEAARSIRYSFFKKVMDEVKADVLMTGHHQDDQVETILMKLTRGSTLEQLTGISISQVFHKGLLIRPLLSFSKKEIYHFAHNQQLDYVEDQSNQELVFTRNRFRNTILPLLKEENPKFNTHIEQFSRDLTDLLELSKQSVEVTFSELVEVDEEWMQFNYDTFFEYSEAMQRAILQKVLETLYKNDQVSYKTNYIEIVREWLLAGDVNTQLDLMEDFTAEKHYNDVVFKKKDNHEPTIEETSFTIEKINHWVQLSPTESIGLFETESDTSSTDTLAFPKDKVTLPLTVRHRQPGDRMTYTGLTGTKKIKDIFIDEKVPTDDRDRAWLVEDARGVILWLISYRKMYLFSEAETDKLTYILKYKKHKKL